MVAYVIAGIFLVFCTLVIFFALRVYKENRKMAPKKSDLSDEDEISFRS